MSTNTDFAGDLAPDPEIVEANEYAAEFEREQQRSVQLSGSELMLGACVLGLWFCLFSGGLLIGTQPFRKAIESPESFTSALQSWLVVVAFWTITNVGLLSCVSAFLGAVGRRTHFTHQTADSRHTINARRENHERLATYYLSAVLRGFGVYTLLLGGLLVLATSSLVSPDQEEYMRLAPTLSIISFYAGYDPRMFSGLLDRVKRFVSSPEPSGNSNGTSVKPV